MTKTRVYLATAIDKEIDTTTYYVMDDERFSRILGRMWTGSRRPWLRSKSRPRREPSRSSKT